MIALPRTLPEGRAGQILAAGLTLAVLALLWMAAVAPCLGWYAGRADQLADERQEISHITALQASLPAMRAQLAASAARASDRTILLAGASDAIAGANLQSALQDLATQAGTSLDSMTMVPAQPAGALRRIGIEVNVTAAWPVLTALFAAIDTATPRMIVDDLTITATAPSDPRQETSLQTAFLVSAFRAGAAP